MVDTTEPSKVKKARGIFVFSVAKHMGPMVTELVDNEEGHASLANMVRVEEIIAVVIGEKVSTELSSVVTVTVPGKKSVVDRMPIEPAHG